MPAFAQPVAYGRHLCALGLDPSDLPALRLRDGLFTFDAFRPVPRSLGACTDRHVALAALSCADGRGPEDGMPPRSAAVFAALGDGSVPNVACLDGVEPGPYDDGLDGLRQLGELLRGNLAEHHSITRASWRVRNWGTPDDARDSMVTLLPGGRALLSFETAHGRPSPDLAAEILSGLACPAAFEILDLSKGCVSGPDGSVLPPRDWRVFRPMRGRDGRTLAILPADVPFA